MKLTIHRGTHEIGGSCVELCSDSGKTRIVIDVGMPLVESEGQPFEWRRYKKLTEEGLLAQKVLPAVDGLYAHQKPSISAVLLSHAHQDHYGFVRFLHPSIQLYMSLGTRSLIEVSNVFLGTNVNLEQAHTFTMWQPFIVGEFKIIPYLMDHSAPDAAAFLIEADGQKLFYTGDFRGHGRKRVLLESLVKKPIKDMDCLVMEGSMLQREKGLYRDEAAVEEAILDVLMKQRSYALVFCSSQNLDRLVSIYRAARRVHATLVIDLYTAFVLDKLHAISTRIPQFDWEGIRILYAYTHAQKLAEHDKRLLYKYKKVKINLDEIRSNPTQTMILCKDNSYFRVMLRHLGELSGAKAIYSMWNGYLARSDLVQVLESAKIELAQIHTSGHAYVSDLRNLATAMNPRFLVPIHTFYPDQYGEIYNCSAIVTLYDGQTYDLTNNMRGEQAMTEGMVINRFFDPDIFRRIQKDVKPLVRLINSSDGEYSLQLRKNYFNIYFQGNSLAKVVPNKNGTYSATIHERFLSEKHDKIRMNLEDYSRASINGKYIVFRIDPKNLHPFFQRKHLEALSSNIRKVNAGEEITFEQVLITDNPPSDNFVLIDRQVADHAMKQQMDLLALTRDSVDRPFYFLVIEVKLGKNPELYGKVGEQLSNYVTHMRIHIRDYVRCYKENYRQKREMGLLGDELQNEIDIEERVEGLVVVAGYSQRAQKAIQSLLERWPDLKVKQMKNEIEPPFIAKNKG